MEFRDIDLISKQDPLESFLDYASNYGPLPISSPSLSYLYHKLYDKDEFSKRKHERLSDAAKKRWSRPGFKEKVAKSISESWKDPCSLHNDKDTKERKSKKHKETCAKNFILKNHGPNCILKVLENDCLQKRIILDADKIYSNWPEIKQRLTQRKSEIVEMRYGLGEDPVPKTLECVASVFGITRERVRQICESVMCLNI